MNRLELTPRLQAVADLVPAGAVLADIGTDHAYLPVWLLLHGRIPRAVASDLRPGPLERARRTARQYGCTDRMEFCLCDGLSGLKPAQAGAIAIAGMGGETICRILEGAPWVASSDYTILLQPMSMQHILRRWLWQHGFRIESEQIACEGNKLYNIIAARFGDARPLSLGEEWAGCQSPDLDQPLRGRYLTQQIDRLRRALDGISRGKSAGSDADAQELRRVFEALAAMREEWEHWQL